MTQISSAAPAIKDALFQASSSLFADDSKVLVVFGHPGTKTADDLILWLGIRTTQTEGPLSVTNRVRYETVDVDVAISSFIGAGDTDKDASDRAYSLLGQIENYARSTDTTLGGTCLWCFLTQTSSNGATQPALIANGRMVDIVATFTAYVRISN